MRFAAPALGQNPGSGGCDHGGVAGGVIQVLVGIEDLGDREAVLARRFQALRRMEWIDRSGPHRSVNRR
jgi:hypothetical protein